MATKSPRVFLHLVCETCKNQNYTTKKNKVENTEKLVLQKYCSTCRKHTSHKETQKVK
ncbi:MAG: 50S ribosomal protein L33 [candidate division WWE3 bacterium]|nr:50S ribosomal protein L33 [candidate division WWE3 bacterium]